nr:SDR family oxidoreductase [Gordonia araii]
MTHHRADCDRRVYLVTGASRGIGAATAARIALRGHHVVINYREKRKRAEAVAAAISSAGGSASVVGADLTAPADVAAMVGEIADDFGSVDGLVLNASGGLELGVGDDYAMLINRDAQLAVVDGFLSLMSVGSRIVFVTSHQAHFVGLHPVPTDYHPVATSKRAGEDAIRSRQAELAARGIGLSVVSGDMIEGTIVVRLLERRDPGLVDGRRELMPLPGVDEFAETVAEEAIRDGVLSRTVFVGGGDYLSTHAG